MKRVTSWVLLISALLIATAQAQEPDDATRAAAREIAKKAITALDAKDYIAAESGFEKAYQILKVPTVGLFLGESLEGLGRLVEASERYREVLGLPLPSVNRAEHEKAQAKAKELLAALERRLPKVTVLTNTKAADARVTLDGRPLASVLLGVEIPINPGAHVLELRIGERATSQELKLAEGQTANVELKLEPAAAPPPSASASAAPPPLASVSASATAPAPPVSTLSSHSSPLKTFGFIGLGIGGAALVFGGVMAGVAAGQNSDLNRSCVTNRCPTSAQDALSSYQRNRVLSTVGFIAGGAFAAGGVVLLLAAPGARSSKQSAQAALSPWLSDGASGVAVSGRF